MASGLRRNHFIRKPIGIGEVPVVTRFAGNNTL